MGRVLEGRELGVGHVVFTVHSFAADRTYSHYSKFHHDFMNGLCPGDTFELLDTIQENDGHLLEL